MQAPLSEGPQLQGLPLFGRAVLRAAQATVQQCRAGEAWEQHCTGGAQVQEFTTNAFTPFTVTTTTPRPPAAAYPPPSASPVPARWSLTNRIFNLNLRSLYQGPPRLPASRLWNPVNSSPRTLQVENPAPAAAHAAPTGVLYPPLRTAPREEHYPNLPIERDVGAREDGRDEYPLLSLPEQRLSRQSPVPSSLAVQRSTAEDSISGRTSIALPRDRRSQQLSQPPTPGPAMASGANPRDSVSPAPHVDKDIEAGRNHQHPQQQQQQQPGMLSRVSLPSSRRTSLGSRRSGSAGDDDADAASEFPWGPSHPCFPHPNPHVPLDSELYNTTRIIRIKRDWMTKDDFRILIKKINDTLIDAFDPFTLRACLDTVMGIATFWLWEDAGFTGVKKQLAELERWIEDWNRDIGAKEAVKIIPLRRTGYLTLDVQIPDPHLGPDTGTRPHTQEENHSDEAPRQQHDQYLPYPITPTLQVNSQPPIIEAQS
ncbi:unnamed protein product [Alternaria alternata]